MAADGTPPLPRGRHRLTRDEVRDSQRQRLLEAMTEEMAVRGYAATSIAHVLARAGVSRSTFYELFESKEDCFATAYELAARTLLAPGAGDAAGGDPTDWLDAVLRRYLDAIADRPAQARVLLVEAYAAGPDVAARRSAALARYAEALGALIGDGTERDRFAARALVAAISHLVTERLVAGDPEGVRALHGPLLDLAARLRA